MSKEKLIPEFRFPEFKGEWSLEELGQCLDYLQPTPFLVDNTDYNDEYEIPVLTAGKSFILGYTNEQEGIFNENLPVIIFDDFTTASQFVDFPFKTKSSAMKILLAKNGNDIKFVYESMQTLNYEVGVHKRHWISVFSKLRIAVPKPQEQQKIASCLSSLDEVIEAHSKKLELLKDHKKGLMQNLFPEEGERVPKFRFPEFENDGEWEEKKLGEVGEFIGGGTPSTSNPDYWDGIIQWYTPTEIKNGTLKGSVRTLSEAGLKNSSAKLLPIGTLLITTRATIGEVAISSTECATNQGFQSLIVKDCEVNLFWYYWILLNKAELERRSSGSTFKEIGRTEIKSISTLSPRKSEQQKIASCLSAVDDLIKAETEKIEALKEHKKGLMQGLFPKIND